MTIDPRVTQLRRLIDRLERLPASTRREWLLAQARARMVDVETGGTPKAVRAFDEEAETLSPAPPRLRSPNGRPVERNGSEPVSPAVSRDRARPTTPPREPPRQVPEPSPAPDASADALGTNELLWLDGPAADAPDEPRGSGGQRWKRGLRG